MAGSQPVVALDLDALGRLCQGLPAGELIALDRVVERKLWEIDRSDVRAVIGGSDDGFLYARGFTVAMGREFHGCAAGDPRMGAPWAECEEMCYLFAHLHHERFGAFPGTGSGICRESGHRGRCRPPHDDGASVVARWR